MIPISFFQRHLNARTDIISVVSFVTLIILLKYSTSFYAKHLSGVLLLLSWCVIIGDSMRCQCQSVQWGTAADDAAGWERNMIKFMNNSFKCPPRDILIQQQLRCIHLQQEVTSMSMQLHGFFFGLLELPWDILSFWRWQLQSATCAEKYHGHWKSSVNQNSVMGWTNVQKIKLTTAIQWTYPVGLHPCTAVCFSNH